MIFLLGTHEVHWLARTNAPLFISARRLRGRKTLPRAAGPWALDSGGFSELSLFGHWQTPAGQYIEETYRWRNQVGNLAWAAVQDWMCEPFIIEKTGLSVREHQKRTTASYFTLRRFADDLPWVPVLQGWHYDDYLQHVEDYREAGIDLAALPLVGIGSVCRRQDTLMAEELICELAGRGIRLHGFGFKLKGLARVHQHLASADSLAWSYAARRSPPLPGCHHSNCANCFRYALRWRERVLRVLLRPVQQTLFAS